MMLYQEMKGTYETKRFVQVIALLFEIVELLFESRRHF
jgi:hypothetical protein